MNEPANAAAQQPSRHALHKFSSGGKMWFHILRGRQGLAIDNVILRSPVFKPYASFKTSWSRIMDYPSYLAFQKAVREHVAPSAPLAAEFWEWRRGAA